MKPGSAPQSCLRSSVCLPPRLHLPRPSGQEALWSGTVSFGGFVQQFCKWTPGPCGYWAATKLLPVATGSGKVPPGSLAAGWLGALLLASVQACAAAWVSSKCQTVPAVHSPKWQRERRNKKFLIFAPQGWGCKACNLCLFSGFFHCLIIAKYFI